MGIVTGYPLGFIFFCLLLGAAYAFILYFRTQKDDIPVWLHRAMTLFRFLSVSIIAFLLLSPLVRKQTEITEKPLIILAQDNSLSILLSPDSGYYRTEYPNQLKEFADNLRKKFEVAELSFGEKTSAGVSISFSEKQTDISALFEEVNNRYANRNIGALILASDGIYNKGSNPFYAAEKTRFPVFTVAMGDTMLARDLILKKITCNKTVFLGDKFPVEILLEADKCAGEKAEVQIKKGEDVLFSRPVQFGAERDFKKISLTLEAKQKGLQRFSVTVHPVTGESSVLNNNQDFYVDVSDTRQKIAILYQSPHPDVFAVKQALESSARFEVETFKLDAFDQPPARYSVIILDQLPSVAGYSNLSRITGSPASLLYILGTETSLDAFNALKTGLSITSNKTNFTETLPAVNEDFSLFTLDKDLSDVLKNVPPLLSPFGTYQHSPAADILLFQKIGNIRSSQPQVLFFQSQERKTGIIAGENLWKWRLSDYQQKGDHKAFDDLINKMVQFLSVKGDKGFFKVNVSNRFMENENVEIGAEVFNESYELINRDDVNITITDEKGNKYPFVLGKTERGYYLNAGNFPPGNYAYQASVKTGKNLYSKKGEFVIIPLNLEALNTVADHNLLFRIAKSHNGEMFYPRELEKLEKKIRAREDIRPVFYTTKRFTDLAGNVWLFLIILALLAGEWFMRKRSGAY
ncbi:MAG: hypothetical protein NTU98_00670 [Bacteroidetes bacterium]|nr:hypothetical protein [Bacteroidota bacterium]